ncbi:hypothetical protein [Serratia marcescens]|uniref:hypothetical protein n=2 Tax=Enterobacterales TaxID=91347 RepID=UPI0013DC4EEB|nr:hypothetical protein [Serratia marcescens]
MDNDALLGGVKSFLAVLAGILGVLGVMNVFKTTNGKLTHWGKLAIGMIVVSTFGGLYIGYMEKVGSNKTKEESDKYNKKLLGEVLRMKHPIENVSLMYWSELPDSEPEVIEFKKVIENYINKTKGARGALYMVKKADIHSSASGIDGKPLNYYVELGSSYIPHKKFPVLNSLLLGYSLGVCLKLKSIPPESFYMVSGDFSTYDWCVSSIAPEKNTLEYDVESKKVMIVSRVNYDKELITSNGSITSTVDLYGSQMFFLGSGWQNINMREILKRMGRPQSSIDRAEKVEVVQRGMKLKSVLIHFSTDKKINISKDKIVKYAKPDGKFFEYIILPKDDDGMKKLH